MKQVNNPSLFVAHYRPADNSWQPWRITCSVSERSLHSFQASWVLQEMGELLGLLHDLGKPIFFRPI